MSEFTLDAFITVSALNVGLGTFRQPRHEALLLALAHLSVLIPSVIPQKLAVFFHKDTFNIIKAHASVNRTRREEIFLSFYLQPGGRRNGGVVQGYPRIVEALEELEEDEEKEEEEAAPASLSPERNRGVNLGNADGKSQPSRSGKKTPGQSSTRSRRKNQEITLTTLDSSNLSPRSD